jgi:hypothetical protein
MDDLYIVRSGAGYFIKFADGALYLTTDPLEAARVDRDSADRIMSRFDDLGFYSDLVRLVFARFS